MAGTTESILTRRYLTNPHYKECFKQYYAQRKLNPDFIAKRKQYRLKANELYNTNEDYRTRIQQSKAKYYQAHKNDLEFKRKRNEYKRKWYLDNKKKSTPAHPIPPCDISKLSLIVSFN